jgi:hypothetical protein
MHSSSLIRMAKMEPILEQLLTSQEACIRYRVRSGVLGEAPEAPELRALREEIRVSTRAQALLSEQAPDGSIQLPAYKKWRGAHWVPASLADIGYPPGDARLLPLREQVLGWLFSPKHQKHILAIQGRTRRCASQEGNALRALLRLGIADERTDELARRLIAWQWPDGGWNCDRRPDASHSSFWESLIPMCALALHGHQTGNRESTASAQRAAELFLKHGLFRRLSDGAPMQPEFLQLFYPWYWRYNILAGLAAMVEASCIHDPRCTEALDWLEARRLPQGGFAADTRFYRVSNSDMSGVSRTAWGTTSARKMNEFVTAEALVVLHAAGRL